jgi:hypothetical protein
MIFAQQRRESIGTLKRREQAYLRKLKNCTDADLRTVLTHQLRTLRNEIVSRGGATC